MIWITMVVWSLTQSQTSWSVKSSGPQEALLRTKLMEANLENSAVATGLEKVSFHSNPKEGNAKKCSNYPTIFLISHTSKYQLFHCVQLFATPWTIYSLPGSSVHGILQARILAFLSPGGLPNPGIEPWSSALQADALPSEPPGESLIFNLTYKLIYTVNVY